MHTIEAQEVLKMIMDELKEVLDKHDLAAHVTITNGSETEYLNHFPEWTGLVFEGDGMVRMKINGSKSEDPIIREKARLKAHKMVGTLVALNKSTGLVLNMSRMLLTELKKKGWEIDENLDHTKHTAH